MKSTEQIIKRLIKIKKDDWAYSALLDLLPESLLTEEQVIGEIRNLLPIAIDKAEDNKWIATTLFMSKFEACLWLLGKNKGELKDLQTEPVSKLKAICAHFDWDFAERRKAYGS